MIIRILMHDTLFLSCCFLLLLIRDVLRNALIDFIAVTRLLKVSIQEEFLLERRFKKISPQIDHP